MAGDTQNVACDQVVVSQVHLGRHAILSSSIVLSLAITSVLIKVSLHFEGAIVLPLVESGRQDHGFEFAMILSYI